MYPEGLLPPQPPCSAPDHLLKCKRSLELGLTAHPWHLRVPGWAVGSSEVGPGSPAPNALCRDSASIWGASWGRGEERVPKPVLQLSWDPSLPGSHGCLQWWALRAVSPGCRARKPYGLHPCSCEPALCPSVFWGREVQERWPRLRFVCFLISLLRYNPRTAQFTHIKYTMQWPLVHLPNTCATVTAVNFRMFYHPKRMFITLKECSITQKECSIIPKGDPILFIYFCWFNSFISYFSFGKHQITWTKLYCSL